MYKRILLKLSGEALADKNDKSIFDSDGVKNIANVIKSLVDNGTQVGVVIGAGNIWRGKLADSLSLERVPADYMGMMGTVINAVAMSGALKVLGVKSKVFSAINEIKDVCEFYDKENAIEMIKHIDFDVNKIELRIIKKKKR